MRRVVFNQKGGVGKSSITVNLAAISASCGLKTLIVDLDTQGNSTHYVMGVHADQLGPNHIGSWFSQTLSFKLLTQKNQSFIHETPYENLFLIPASETLADLQPQLEGKHKIYKLRDMLRSLDAFDAVYIDTPPALNFYTMSALIAANACLIPFDCDAFSRQALYTLMRNIEETRIDHNPGLAVEGIIVNQFMPRASLPGEMVAMLREEGLPILNQYLSASVKMRESHQANKPLIHLAPSHKLTQEYLGLFYELHPQLWEASVEEVVVNATMPDAIDA